MINSLRAMTAALSAMAALLSMGGAAQGQIVGTYEGTTEPGSLPIQIDVGYDSTSGQMYVSAVRMPSYVIACAQDGGYVQPWSVDAGGYLALLNGRSAASTVYGAMTKFRGRWDFGRANEVSGVVQVAAAQYAGLDGQGKKPQSCLGPSVSFVAKYQDVAQPWLSKGPGGVTMRVHRDGTTDEAILRGVIQ